MSGSGPVQRVLTIDNGLLVVQSGHRTAEFVCVVLPIRGALREGLGR